MSNITEIDIRKTFIGRTACMDKLSRCAKRNRTTSNSNEYIVYSCSFIYNQELRELFGVTDKLKELWERRGTEFNIYLYIQDDILTDSHILKYTESGGARPSMTTPKCTQQELRIARRILDYVTLK